MELNSEINLLIRNVTQAVGKPIEENKYEIVDRGLPHKPKTLPAGKMGIYTFSYNDRFLKIGKAASKSSARFLSQHYNPKSANSTLAASILRDYEMLELGINEANVGDWIKENCRRIDVLITEELGVFTLDLIEAVLHYKYEPKYEGFTTQR